VLRRVQEIVFPVLMYDRKRKRRSIYCQKRAYEVGVSHSYASVRSSNQTAYLNILQQGATCVLTARYRQKGLLDSGRLFEVLRQ
jgi:hypothetical protein